MRFSFRSRHERHALAPLRLLGEAEARDTPLRGTAVPPTTPGVAYEGTAMGPSPSCARPKEMLVRPMGRARSSVASLSTHRQRPLLGDGQAGKGATASVEGEGAHGVGVFPRGCSVRPRPGGCV